MPHLWARWLHNPYRLGDPLHFTAGDKKSEEAHKWARWLHNPCRLGDPLRFRAGGTIRSGPLVGKAATYPLPPGGSPPLHSEGQNQKWPTSGQGGYITPAASRSPSASERGAESEVAQKWVRWLHNLFCAFHPFLNSPRNSYFFEYRHIGSSKKNSPCRTTETKSAVPPTKHIVPCDNFGVRRGGGGPPLFWVGSRPRSAPVGPTLLDCRTAHVVLPGGRGQHPTACVCRRGI